MSLVDVVVPCYNYAHFLPQCVNSILTQSGVDTRVLIIDDCSTDESQLVGLDLAKSDKRVTYRRHEVNKGHIATYNEGLLEWADSDFVLLLSADDMLAPGALNRAVQVMMAHPEVGFCYGRQLEFVNDVPADLNKKRTDRFDYEISSGNDLIQMSCDGGDNPIATPTAVLRTSIQKQAGGYDPDLPHSGDLEMWLRCASLAAVGYVNVVQAFKRAHEKNMVTQYVSTVLPDLLQRQRAFESAFSKCSGRIDGADTLLQTARRSLSGHAFWSACKQFETGNIELCDELMSYAKELDPLWPRRKEWRYMKIKRFIGSRLWNTLAPLVDLARKKTSPKIAKAKALS